MTSSTPQQPPPGGRQGQSGKAQKKTSRQVLIRACIYIAATHLWAGLLILLFAVGSRH